MDRGYAPLLATFDSLGIAAITANYQQPDQHLSPAHPPPKTKINTNLRSRSAQAASEAAESMLAGIGAHCRDNRGDRAATAAFEDMAR